MLSSPQPPRHLSRRASVFWRQVVARSVLEPHQLELLRRACEATDRADEARNVLECEGLTLTDRDGQLVPHPCVQIEQDARDAFVGLMRDLNL